MIGTLANERNDVGKFAASEYGLFDAVAGGNLICTMLVKKDGD